MSCFKSCQVTYNLKIVPAIFYQILIFSPDDSLSKAIKNVFCSSKKLFPLLRYSIFCNYFPPFPHFLDSKGQMGLIILFQNFLHAISVLGYLPKLKKGLGLAFSDIFCMIFLVKCSLFNTLSLVKFQCHTFFLLKMSNKICY